MADISQIEVNGTTYNICDAIARNDISELQTNNDIFLIFGDSWADFGSGFENWSTEVNDVLNCGTILNYGVGGATFVYNSSNLIKTQVNNAISQLSSTQKNNVKYIMVMGGVNDHHPTAPNTYTDDVMDVLKLCKNNFPHAIIQFFPTSCTPDYDNSSGPKWLWCQIDFWKVAQNLAASNEVNASNRFSVPSCGIAFYWNQNSPISAFFRSDKLHLGAYGKHAIVQAILEGYGKCNIPYIRSQSYQPNSSENRHIAVTYTPTSIQLTGDFKITSALDKVSFGNSGQRLALALVGSQYNSNFPCELKVWGACDGAGALKGWLSIHLINNDTTCGISSSNSVVNSTCYILN